jgi:pimeloyl-ACP methyl ester carboxylesterase
MNVLKALLTSRRVERKRVSEKKLNVANHTCHALFNRASGVPIVFLHGYSFTSEVWQRTGITALLEEKQVPFLALDMPYGAKSDCRPRSRDVEVNVAVVHEALQAIFGAEVPILVGASVGGHIALQYAARFPVKGLLLLAPVRVLEETLTKAYPQFTFPVRIIIGSEDRVASLEELKNLADKLPDAKITVYQNEGHAAYVARPDRFKRDLLELYVLMEQ